MKIRRHVGQWTADVTLLLHTGPEPTAEQWDQLAARGVAVVDGEVAGLVVTDDRLTGVRLASGQVIARQVVVVGSRFAARDGVLASLGIRSVEHAMGFGSHVPAGPAGDLIVEDTATAVAERAATGAGFPEPDGDVVLDEAFWDGMYNSHSHVWSGQPNSQLLAEAADLTPGTALDVGCGEGADAIWLAQRGWQVTALDISATAIRRGEAHAAQPGADVAGRITWLQYDLVTAQLVHVPAAGRETLHARLAAAVSPGGTLLVVGHHPSDIHAGAGRWSMPGLLFTGERGGETTVHDAVLTARRRPAT